MWEAHENVHDLEGINGRLCTVLSKLQASICNAESAASHNNMLEFDRTYVPA